MHLLISECKYCDVYITGKEEDSRHGATGDLVKRNMSGTHSGEPVALTYMWDLKVMAGYQVVII